MTGLTAIWAGVHLQLARLTDCPELVIGEGEARQFLLAWQNYLRHYSITATQRTVDLMTAVGVTAFLYTPRVFALAARRQGARPGRAVAPRTGQPNRDDWAGAQVFQFAAANGRTEPGEPAPILADGPLDAAD